MGLDANKPLRVVVGDADEIYRAGLCATVASSESCVVVAEVDEGAALLDCVRACAPDVVLMSAHLPGLDGVALSEILRTAFPEVRRFVVGSAHGDCPRRAHRLGAETILPRGSSAREVLRALESELDPAALHSE